MSYLQKAREWEAKRKAKREPTEAHEAHAREAARLLQEQGWCAVQCRTLGGEVVIWVRDEKVAIPAQWKDAVIYTLDELRNLASEPRLVQKELRQLHEVKRIFKGTIKGSDD